MCVTMLQALLSQGQAVACSPETSLSSQHQTRGHEDPFAQADLGKLRHTSHGPVLTAHSVSFGGITVTTQNRLFQK